MDSNTVLIIVPHGDDEALMCGGLIHKFHKTGVNIEVAYVRAAMDDRTTKQIKSTEKSSNVLGINKTHFLGLSEAETAHNFLKLKVAVEKLIDEVKPLSVITTFYGDNHQDHKNTFRAVSVACRHHNAPFVKRILVGEINSSTEQDISPDVFNPNYYITLDEADITAKCNAMEAYTTERRLPPHPRSPENIRALARVRGMAIGVQYAEAYMMLRCIS